MSGITQKNTAATAGQIRMLGQVATAAVLKSLEETSLNNIDAQRIIEHGDKFSIGIRESVTRLLQGLSASDTFQNEEVLSDEGYYSGYEPKSIAEQMKILRGLFPKIGNADESLAEGKLPLGAEGWFAIPRWQDFAATYAEAVEIALAKIEEVYGDNFYNCHKGRLGLYSLRQSVETADMLERIGQEQEFYDVLVIPAQFGLRHRGRSIRRSVEVFADDEFGLGVFAICIMILTHPERIMHHSDLWIDCFGDEYDDPNSGVRIDYSIFFGFIRDRVECDMGWSGYVDRGCGLASGFFVSVE